jgi:hypothetical protein
MMMAIVLFFMGPSPDVSTQTIVNADHALRRVHKLFIAPYCSQIENPARRRAI